MNQWNFDLILELFKICKENNIGVFGVNLFNPIFTVNKKDKEEFEKLLKKFIKENNL